MRYYCSILFALSTLLFACGKKSPCLKSTGKDVTNTRDFPVFTKLNVFDKIDIELKKSTVNKATITCGENLADYISTEISGDELTIENKNKCNLLRTFKRRVKIVLEYTSLNSINFVGAGTLSSTDSLYQPYLFIEGEGCSGDINLILKTDSVRFTLHTGNTNLNLKGTTNKAFIYSGGTTIVHAEDLICYQAFLNNSGSGDFYVQVTNYLFALVAQQGSIFFKGNCNLDAHTNGSGEIHKL